jgi:8-oxo-dGTP pyrophosphatase MutT (NUDIX family)
LAQRGSRQVIPRPADSRPGGPPPWADVPVPQRVISLDGLRRVFAGRTGAPADVEARERSARPSAVLAACYEDDRETYVVLTRRARDLRAHRGEVSFPGGAVDPGERLEAAAVREAHEEIGLDPASVEVLGELDHLTTITSRSFIVPFVAVLDGRPELVANPAEVDLVLRVPLAELLRDDVFHEEWWRHDRFGTLIDHPIFFFELAGDTVWGATAAMLRQFLALALELEAGVDHP